MVFYFRSPIRGPYPNLFFPPVFVKMVRFQTSRQGYNKHDKKTADNLHLLLVRLLVFMGWIKRRLAVLRTVIPLRVSLQIRG